MRFNPRVLFLALCCVTTAQAADPAAVAPAASAAEAVKPVVVPLNTNSEFKTPKEQISYATGVSSVRNMIRQNVDFDLEIMIRGMRDAMAGGRLALNEKEVKIAMQSLMAEMRRSQAANQRALADKNFKRGNDFRERFKKKENVTQLGNGVLYRVINKGEGNKPTDLDSVVVKYRGTTIDGVEFDATEANKTATLRMQQVIIGWREALKQMPQGSKWEIVIPPNLAYGDKGVGDSIAPNETLVFEVELLQIKSPEMPVLPLNKAPAAKAPEAKAPEAKAAETKATEMKAPEVKAPAK